MHSRQEKKVVKSRRSRIEPLEERVVLSARPLFLSLPEPTDVITEPVKVEGQFGFSQPSDAAFVGPVAGQSSLQANVAYPEPPHRVAVSLVAHEDLARPFVEWSQSESGDVLRYEAVVVPVGSSPNDLNLVAQRGMVDAAGPNGAQFEHPFEAGEYDFFVRAISSDSLASAWSAPVRIAINSGETTAPEEQVIQSSDIALAAASTGAHSINFSFIREQEGFETVGYVPAENGVPIGQSGVTISVGFDLGQHNQAYLDSTGWPQTLIDKLSPYLGLTGTAAQSALTATPLTVTNAEAILIADTVHEDQAQLVIADYNASATTVPFNELPEPAQTVIASVAFQYGNLPTETPLFWGHVTSQDWTSTIAELRNFGDDFPSRRGREADYLENGLAAIDTMGPSGLRMVAASDTGRSDADGVTQEPRPAFEWDTVTQGVGGLPVAQFEWVLTTQGANPDDTPAIIQQGAVADPAATSFQLPISLINDGDYTLHLRTVQADSIASSWSTTNMTLDRVAPVAPNMPADPADGATTPLYRDAITADTTPNFQWEHPESDAFFLYEIDEATTLGQPFPDFGNADYTIEVEQNQVLDSDYQSVLPNGVPDSTQWQWRTRAVDVAGNIGPVSGFSGFRLREGNLPVTDPGHAITQRIQRPAGIGNNHVEQIDVFLQRIVDPSGTTAAIESEVTTWVVAHGRSDNSASFFELAGLLDGYEEGDQILVMDWGDGSNDNPGILGLDGAEWIPSIASWAVDTLVTDLSIAPSALRLVGHSWGSYLVYEISKQVNELTQDNVGAIVGLDPATTSLGYPASEVNFSEFSDNSWAFYGGGFFGSAQRSATAHESFAVDYNAGVLRVEPSTFAAHSSPVRVFETLVSDQLSDRPHKLSFEFFNLDRLISGERGPWRENAIGAGLNFPINEFEGEFFVTNINGADAKGNTQWGDIYDEFNSFVYRDDATNESIILDPDAYGPVARIVDSSGAPYDRRLDFAGVFDATSEIHQFTILNEGEETLEISDLSISGDFSRFELRITNNGQVYEQTIASFTDSDGRFIDSIRIEAGQEAQVQVKQLTRSVGTYEAAFEFTHNGGGLASPVSVSLHGVLDEPAGDRLFELQGEDGQASSVFVFPPVAADSTGSEIIVTLANTGQKTVSLDTISLEGANASEFEVRTSLGTGTVLLPGARLPLYVRYTPTTDGLRTAELVVTHNVGSGETRATLSSQALTTPDFGGSPPATGVVWNNLDQKLEVTVREGDVVAIDLSASDLTGDQYRAASNWDFGSNQLGDFRSVTGGRIAGTPTAGNLLDSSTIYFAPRLDAVTTDAAAPNVTSVQFDDDNGNTRTIEITVVPNVYSTTGEHAVPTSVLSQTGELQNIDFRTDPDGDGIDDDQSGSTTDDFEVATMRLQQRLRFLGFLGERGQSLAVDGDYGRNTGHALAVFNASLSSGSDVVYKNDKLANGTRATQEQAIELGWVPSDSLLSRLDDRINATYAPRWVELQSSTLFPYSTDGQGNVTQVERWGSSYTQILLDTLASELGGTPLEQNSYPNIGTSLEAGGETKFHASHEAGRSVDIDTPGNNSGSIPFFHTRLIDNVRYVAKPGPGDDQILVAKPAGGWEYQAVPTDAAARATFLQGAVTRQDVQHSRSNPADRNSVLISEYLHDAAGYSSSDIERILTVLDKYTTEPLRDADGNAVAVVDLVYLNDPLFFETVPGGEEFTPFEDDTDRVRTRTPLKGVKPASFHNGHIHLQIKAVNPADYPPAATNSEGATPAFATAEPVERALTVEERTTLSQGLDNLVPTVVNAFMEAAPINTVLEFLADPNSPNEPFEVSDAFSGIQDALSQTLFDPLTDYLDRSDSVSAEGLVREILEAEALGGLAVLGTIR